MSGHVHTHGPGGCGHTIDLPVMPLPPEPPPENDFPCCTAQPAEPAPDWVEPAQRERLTWYAENLKPKPAPVPDLAAALRATVDEAKARRLGSTEPAPVVCRSLQGSPASAATGQATSRQPTSGQGWAGGIN